MRGISRGRAAKKCGEFPDKRLTYRLFTALYSRLELIQLVSPALLARCRSSRRETFRRKQPRRQWFVRAISAGIAGRSIATGIEGLDRLTLPAASPAEAEVSPRGATVRRPTRRVAFLSRLRDRPRQIRRSSLQTMTRSVRRQAAAAAGVDLSAALSGSRPHGGPGRRNAARGRDQRRISPRHSPISAFRRSARESSRSVCRMGFVARAARAHTMPPSWWPVPIQYRGPRRTPCSGSNAVSRGWSEKVRAGRGSLAGMAARCRRREETRRRPGGAAAVRFHTHHFAEGSDQAVSCQILRQRRYPPRPRKQDGEQVCLRLLKLLAVARGLPAHSSLSAGGAAAEASPTPRRKRSRPRRKQSAARVVAASKSFHARRRCARRTDCGRLRRSFGNFIARASDPKVQALARGRSRDRRDDLPASKMPAPWRGGLSADVDGLDVHFGFSEEGSACIHRGRRRGRRSRGAGRQHHGEQARGARRSQISARPSSSLRDQ